VVFIRDTEQSLKAAVYLVNTLPGFDGEDTLQTIADFDAYLQINPYTGEIRRDESELAAIRAIRPRLRRLWDVDREGAVPLVNEMLRDGRALPRLVIHDDYDWHIHATSDDAPLATRILVEAAMAFVDVIRSDEYDRVRVCAADDCDSVYIDYSRNGSKRYCDTGNCGNRMNVNAYRERKARETA
jgi:predicted RNA-binding Zn ribbon-like protein